jgi:SAM-dependent methyltransferase
MTWRTRTARALLRLTRGLDSAVCSLLLGMLRPEDLKGVTLSAYEQSSEYNQDRLEETLLEPMATLAPGRRLLDLCCGTGREAEIFARNGYQITGVDFSDRALALAREYLRDKQLEARLIVGDFQNFTIGEQFDVIYLSPWAYTFVAGRKPRIEFLRRLATMLSVRGVVVISFGLASNRAWEKTRFWIGKVASILSNGNPVLEHRDRLSGNLFIHLFVDDEAEREVAAAGFEIIHRQSDGPHFRTLILRHLNRVQSATSILHDSAGTSAKFAGHPASPRLSIN